MSYKSEKNRVFKYSNVDAVTIHQKFHNVIIVQYPEEVSTEYLRGLMDELFRKSVMLEKFILLNIGSSFKKRTNPEQNELIKQSINDLDNLCHIIFVTKDIPLVTKLSIKFSMGVLHRDKYSIVESVEEADELIEKFISKW